MKCKKHPKYQAKRAPRVPCRDCWAMFLGMCETCVNCGCQHVECETDDTAVDFDPTAGL